MMSFNPKKMPHLLSLIVAIITAVGMWYVVSVRDRLEAQLEVSIDYNGVPPNLVITDGLISKVHVRMRGPELLLRAISQQTLTQAINLSGIKKGTTVVPLSGEHMGPQLRAFERVAIPAGGSHRVEFTLGGEAFALCDRQLRRVVEPGAFRIAVGASSEDIRLEQIIELE